jgi:uncharacterized protein (TIGR00661 family)
MKHILVSPLSWGLGHATRDLPIIRCFLEHGHHVTVAACGRGFTLLKQEVPQCDFVEMLDYPSPYSESKYFVPKFLAMAPVMLAAIERETYLVRRLFKQRKFDLVLSDNRFRVRSRHIPSFVISHQLRFMTPPRLTAFEFMTEFFNRMYLNPFDRVIVPDAADPVENLSGRMSHQMRWMKQDNKVYYAGVIASVPKLDLPEDIDVFISISGPEPQRTQLEKIILSQVSDLKDLRVVVTLGQPEVKETRQIGNNITVYGYLDRKGQAEMMNRAKLVVCRSGYTTVMELAELGKKALMIPTPGQTEQEYLGRFYADHGYYHCVSQYELKLAENIKKARDLTGARCTSRTHENVEKLYKDLFAPVLD